MIETSFSLNHTEEVYRFENLNNRKGVEHVFTTRHAFSVPDFNLSFHTGIEAEVKHNREQLQHFFKGASLTIPNQCHGIRVEQITKDNGHEVPKETDALVTNQRGLVIGVLSADCVPILFYDANRQVLGAAHAGWKGTVANIAEATIHRMRELYGSDPSDIEAYIGPSISQYNFEVGEEVAESFEKLGLTACVIRHLKNKSHVDLWMANQLLLQRIGVKDDHVHTARVCTYDHTDKFYSARKEGFQTGRFGAFIMLT